MGLGKLVRNVVQLALIGGCIWFAVTWSRGSSERDGDAAYAEASCVDAIGARFDGQPVKAYAVDRSERGFVVRASVTVRGDTPVKVLCLANQRGGVEELRFVER